MSTRGRRIKMVARRRAPQQQAIDLNGSPSQPQRNTPVVPQPISVPPRIDLDAIDDDDDDDVIESTASDFAKAKNKSRGTLQGTLLVGVESSGGSTRLTKNSTKRRSGQASVDGNKSRKSEAVVAPPAEEPNCPICMCPFTEETSTKCGHIFCNSCIKNAISRQSACPTCRKKASSKDLRRVFLPTTR